MEPDYRNWGEHVGLIQLGHYRLQLQALVHAVISLLAQ